MLFYPFYDKLLLNCLCIENPFFSTYHSSHVYFLAFFIHVFGANKR